MTNNIDDKTALLDEVDALDNEDFVEFMKTAFWRRRRNHRNCEIKIGEALGNILCDASNGCCEKDVAIGMQMGIFEKQHRTLQQGAVRIFQRTLVNWARLVSDNPNWYLDDRNKQAYELAKIVGEIPLPLV